MLSWKSTINLKEIKKSSGKNFRVWENFEKTLNFSNWVLKFLNLISILVQSKQPVFYLENFRKIYESKNSRSVMHAGYFGLRGSTKCLGGPFFEGRDQILLCGEALKLLGNFAKIRIIKNLKNYRYFSEKLQSFTKIFVFFCSLGKIKIIKYWL